MTGRFRKPDAGHRDDE